MMIKIKNNDTLAYYNFQAYQFYLKHPKNHQWRKEFNKTENFHNGKRKLIQFHSKEGLICFLCKKNILREERTYIFYLDKKPHPKRIFDPEVAKITHKTCVGKSRLRW